MNYSQHKKVYHLVVLFTNRKEIKVVRSDSCLVKNIKEIQFHQMYKIRYADEIYEDAFILNFFGK